MLLTGFWALISLAIAVTVLNLAISAMDRLAERRPIVARQIALGVPSRVLRRAQTLQTAVPLAGAVLLGVTGGAAALVSYALADYRRGVIDIPWPQLGLALGAVLIGSALVIGLTLPLSRVRLTPALLRRE
jgi:predicted lysophospholipase L1 biosynthesis ABC-type transport system permease subunit